MTKKISPNIFLGFVAMALLAPLLLLMADYGPQEFSWVAPYFLASGASLLLLLTVGLILMIKQRLYKGGVIVLFAGIASLVVTSFIGGDIFLFFMEPYPLFLMLSSILAIISGSSGIKKSEEYLGIKKGEEHKRDYRGLIIPITGLLLAIAPAFVFIYDYVRPFFICHHVRHIHTPILGDAPGGPMFVAFTLIPLSIIATILNVISVFKVRKETNPKAKIIAKILIGFTWSMIIIFVVLFFIWIN